jgi:hypothetical protein
MNNDLIVLGIVGMLSTLPEGTTRREFLKLMCLDDPELEVQVLWLLGEPVVSGQNGQTA